MPGIQEFDSAQVASINLDAAPAGDTKLIVLNFCISSELRELSECAYFAKNSARRTAAQTSCVPHKGFSY